MLSLLNTAKTALSASPHKIYLALLVALTIFWIGAAHTAVSANECDAGAYRDLSFAELAYSDISALHADRGCKPHKMPFVEDRVEYPVLLALAMWAPSHVAPTGTGYLLLSAIMLAAALIVMGVSLFHIKGASPWVMMASPALYVYGTLNWDLLALAALALGLALIPPEPDRASGAVVVMPKVVYFGLFAITLGVWTKLFPIVAVWVLIVVAFRRYGLKSAVLLGALFAAVSFVINAPFAFSAFENWSYFFKFNGTRQIDPSLYTMMGLDPKQDIEIANKTSFALLATGALFVAGTDFWKKGGKVAALTGLLLVIWLLGNKVYSPQYWLWALFGYAVAGGRTWVGLLAGAVATLEHLSVFSILSQKGYGFMLDWQPWFRERYWDCVHLRYVIFAILAVDIIIKLFRSDKAAGSDHVRPEVAAATE
jgi:hypothetical protein